MASNFTLPDGWLKCEFLEGLPVYYNYRDRQFSLAPVMDGHQFVLVYVSLQ
jgi:hypothetical protein